MIEEIYNEEVHENSELDEMELSKADYEHEILEEMDKEMENDNEAQAELADELRKEHQEESEIIDNRY